MSTFIVSPAARQDLFDIRDYLVREAGRKVAARVLKKLREGMDRLVAMPGMGHRRADLAAESLRFYTVFRYLIVYRAESSPLWIVRVLHGARDLSAALQDEV